MKFLYIIQPIDSGHLARGELVNIEFIRLNHKVNGGIKKVFLPVDSGHLAGVEFFR